MIHFTNGSIVVDLLTEAGVPGRVVQCADPLHDGPLMQGLDPTEWQELRSRFLAGSGDVALADIRADLAARQRTIESAADEDEVVLWFEHDLFDQLNLIWLLDALAAAGTRCEHIRLVVIGAHPEVPRFHGLGQLSPAQLLALFPDRIALTDAALDEAQAAFFEVCGSDPRPSLERARRPSAHWRWLPGALVRLWEELPGVGSGLSRTERQGVEAIASGATTLGEAFAASAEREERRFLGDWSFFETMRRLARAREPLLAIGSSTDARSAAVELTGFGRDVLAGTADHAGVNGLDRWVGGVYLSGTAPAWRWDGRTAVGPN